MSDITNVYKATVKAIQSREKPGVVDQSILKKKKKKGSFSKNAHQLLSEITNMRKLVNDSQSAYINISSHFNTDGEDINEEERDVFDSQFQRFVEQCVHSIDSFKSLNDDNKSNIQVTQHREEVCKLLKTYLFDISTIYGDINSVRNKRSADINTMSSLNIKNISQNDSVTEANTPSYSRISKQTINENPVPFHLENYKQEVVLSQEDMQMLKQENDTMISDISLIFKEVDQVEQKVFEITKLQNIICQNIMQQEPTINKIAETALITTENIKIGNNDIKKAMKNKAGIRVWILFFLLLCSFSLLFLDWYNP